jgi:F0F1-type ATP synthase membrane subunit b/b'
MNILLDLHFYLVISFVVSLVLISKFVFRKIDEFAKSKSGSVGSLIANLDAKAKKLECEFDLELERLDKTERESKALILKAEETSDRMLSSTSEKVLDIQKRNRVLISRLVECQKRALLVDLLNKIVDCVIDDSVRKIKGSLNDPDMQSAFLDKSLKMLSNAV